MNSSYTKGQRSKKSKEDTKLKKRLDKVWWVWYNITVVFRGVAQFGRALRSGRRGRGFKSRHLDQSLAVTGIVRHGFFYHQNLTPQGEFLYYLNK